MLPRVNLVRTDEADYLLMSTRDAISATIYQNGHWAKLITEMGLAFCAGLEAPLVLDVGANLGGFAIPLAQKLAATGGRVFAFEPQRIVFYQLCGNTFLNRLENLHPLQLALGRREGRITLSDIDYLTSTNAGGFSLDPDAALHHGHVTTKAGAYQVEMKRLDTLDLPKVPALIKIDVEGLELDVLEGAESLIRAADFPPLLLEAWTAAWYADQRARLVAYLEGLGYGSFMLGDEIIAQHPAHPRQFAFDLDEASGLRMTRTR